LCNAIFENGTIVKVSLNNGGYHLQLRCPNCNSFIKNLPHSKHDTLYFGKYKGKKIKEIAQKDPKYLQWLITRNIKNSLRLAIQKELEEIYEEQI
jgi:hypothetical protein